MIEIDFDHQIFSLQQFGGATRYFMNLGQALIVNPEVRLRLSLGIYDKSFIYESLHPHIFGLSNNYFRLGHGLLRFSINEIFAHSIRAATRTVAKSRVHHCTYMYPVHLTRNVPLVVTHHDCTLERFKSQFRRSSLTIALKQRIYQRADKIIAISNHSKSDLMEYYKIPENKIQVVYHGLEKPILRHLAAKPFNLNQNSNILYVGARTFYKNFKLLLQAFACSKAKWDFNLTAVGGGAFTQEEVALMRNLGIEERVECVPYALQSELAWLYYNSHLMVYPSKYEGFGFPPLEAMSASCPTLVAKASCLPEILGDGVLYFESENSDDLKEKLDLLAYDTTLRAALIKTGGEIIKKYTWEKSASQTLDVYNSAIG